ncbi:unnamed protein product [Diabrotica balteata]|uniref:Multidrug resistance-associated protein lethal(2)03659 n=1 Tax=Diabrotica balteata TaxID=107213 RepID=A0A9N9SKI9_DIABA|nr:unnamed protein product [Diabrotica balteata]
MIQIVVGILFSKFGFYTLVMAYIWFGYATDTELIFYLSTMFKDIEYYLGGLIPYGLGSAAELYSALRRINQVITAEELPPKIGSDEPTNEPILELREADVTINNNLILNNINFKAKPGLTLVTGKVGSGKSSLLKALLQDYPLDKGCILSKGRISYASQDPWLFPSSIKQNIIFGEKFDEKRYLETIRVCALEFDFKMFEKRDETIVCDRGMNLSKGQQARINLARAVYKESEIYLLDDSLTALDSQVQDYIFNECIKKFLNGKICILVTQTLNQIKNAENLVIMENGQIKLIDKPDEKNIEELKTIITSNEVSDESQDNDNKTNHVNNEKDYLNDEDDEYRDDEKLLETEQTKRPKIYGEIIKKGKVSLSIYNQYLVYGGGILFLIFNIFLFGVTQGAESLSDYLLTRWVDQQQIVLTFKNVTHNNTYNKAVEHSEYIIKIYSTTIFLHAILATVSTYTILELGRRASINLHKTLISKLTGSLMSFFDTHFLGNILNRCSQDLSNVDEQVAFVISEFMRVAFVLTSIVIMISLIKLSFLACAAVIFSSLYFMRKVYLPTGRTLKRLETTNNTAGDVGLAITQVIALSGEVEWGVRQWADLESYMTSVERLLEYTHIKSEPTDGRIVQNWPSEGSIVYERVSLTYNDNEMVLKDLNFKIKPREKIGIVGRTGAGKSSIIASIFRLYEAEGNIFIDGVEIKTLSLNFLRKKIAIIPQDPILFSGTIRTNLDPFNEYNDQELWSALEKVGIRDIIPDLDHNVKGYVSSFSSGQRQLISVARAILRKNKIVILDEATANMDHETDAMLYKIIEENFKNCTVLTIAHRLDTIIKSDRVMVLDRGEIKEFDAPSTLLTNTNGIFYSLVQQSEGSK